MNRKTSVATKSKITRIDLRQQILQQTELFCLTDIFNRIDKIQPVEHELILSELDKLYAQGLISFEHLSEKKGNTEWAFVVDNDIMNASIKK